MRTYPVVMDFFFGKEISEFTVADVVNQLLEALKLLNMYGLAHGSIDLNCVHIIREQKSSRLFSICLSQVSRALE
jgi:hypothetical protein